MFISLALLLTSAWGIEGHYVYQGDQETISTVRKETVYPGSAAGKARIEALREEGYSCAAKLQFVQCALNSDPEDLKSWYVPVVKEVIFGPLISLNTLFEGESLIQYEADQTVTVNGVSYSKAMYYEFKTFVKISVGNVDQGNYFSFVVGKNSIASIEQINKTESKWVYKTHWVESTLQLK